MILRGILAAFALACCGSAFAALPGRRLIAPVAGRVTGAGGQEYRTTLYITNLGSRDAEVRISFLVGGQSNPAPATSIKRIPAGSTEVIHDVTEQLFHRRNVLGALLIASNRLISAECRVAWTPADAGEGASHGASFSAVPVRAAIGLGSAGTLHGAGSGPHSDFRYNIHLVEANGTSSAVVISVEALDGREIGKTTRLLRPWEPMTIPLTDITPKPPADARVRVRLVRGGGKVVAAGSQIANISQTATGHDMTLERGWRLSIPRFELAVYLSVALALIVSGVAGVIRSRRRQG